MLGVCFLDKANPWPLTFKPQCCIRRAFYVPHSLPFQYAFSMSRKLAVLAEVALALERNRQGAGPLETLKLSS
jgi:hypothetical protein